MNTRKQCTNCHKRRDLKFFETPRSLICGVCKISIKAGKKREKRVHSQSYWVEKLDSLARAECRKRGACEGDRAHKGNLQWAHIISRTYKNTRWWSSNCLLLCAACHKYYTEHPVEWEIFRDNKIGALNYLVIREEALKPFTKSPADLEEKYKLKLQELEEK